MKIEQLSTNGFQIFDAFDKVLLKEIIDLIDSFEPTNVIKSHDGPGLPLQKSGARREVFLLPNNDLKNRIVNNFGLSIWHSAVELWRDFDGYRNAPHFDAENVHNIIIIYLDSTDGENMGTCYHENDTEYRIKYKINQGIKLLNSNKVWHGMIGEVDVTYRKTIYINWKSNV